MPKSFTKFLLEWDTKDLGLRNAIAKTCKTYMADSENFPDSILRKKNNLPDRYDHLVRKINQCVKSGQLIQTSDGKKQNRFTVDTVYNWIGDDAKRRNSAPPLHVERIAIKLFYYYKYGHTDKTGSHTEKYYYQCLGYLENEGVIAKRRAIRLAAKNTGQSTKLSASLVEINDSNQKIHPIDRESKIDERAYLSYPRSKVDKYYENLVQREVEEIYEDRINWTKGIPSADPEGLLRSWLNDGLFGLRWSEEFRDSVQRRIQPSHVSDQLALLARDPSNIKQGDLFSNASGDSLGLSCNLGSVAEPSETFMKLAIDCIGNTAQIRSLYEACSDELTYGIARCLTFHERGTNLKLCTYVFHLMSRIDNFSWYTRMAASYIRSIFETLRGNINGIYSACDDAEYFLKMESGIRSSTPVQPLLAQIHARRSTTTYNALTLAQLDNIKNISRIEKEVALSVGFAGLHEGHFENPDELAKQIVRKPEMANGLYISTEVHYSTQILRCIVSGDDPSELFRCAMIVNEAVAKIEPYTACVVLTPLMMLAEIAELPDIALKVYGWRHGRHPETSVNQIRRKIDDKNNFGIEAAIELLATYSFMRNRAKRGDNKSKNIYEDLTKQLLDVEHKIASVGMDTVHRYYARFQAEIGRDKRAYIKSESEDAYSHNLYFGLWNDGFSQS